MRLKMRKKVKLVVIVYKFNFSLDGTSCYMIWICLTDTYLKNILVDIVNSFPKVNFMSNNVLQRLYQLKL